VQALQALIQRLARTELMELQEQYVAIFDRGRALSLHLFEHIHGESRDRGQAMVNLLEVYRRHGFELDARELPDYLPLFLEYLAQRPAEEALELLAETAHVLTCWVRGWPKRGNDYHTVFDALTVLVANRRTAPTSVSRRRPKARIRRW
jgi:nitrate reductase delta subunit